MISFFGQCIQNLIIAVKYIFSGRMRLLHAVNQAVEISCNSLPIILAVVSITAAVITIQISKQFLMTGAETYVGGSLLIILLREIGPGFTALAVGARAGTAISAEIAVPALAPIARATNPGAISLIITIAIEPPT